MDIILINYNFTPNWLLDYPEFSPVTIYDRSDDGVTRKLDRFGKVIKTINHGNVDFDRLTYIIDNYETLPDVFLLSKSNLFKFITKEEFESVKDNTTFTPLLTQDHKTYSDRYGVVCYYYKSLYYERNDDWFLYAVPPRYVSTWDEWAKMFDLPNPDYIPFFPGGNCILTKETVWKYPKEYYERMRETLNWTMLPGEAYLVERSYYLMWK